MTDAIVKFQYLLVMKTLYFFFLMLYQGFIVSASWLVWLEFQPWRLLRKRVDRGRDTRALR